MTTKNISFLIENELNKASVVLAVKAITDKLQSLAENMAKIEANDIMPILDNMQTAFGTEMADQFNQSATEKLRAVINSLKEAKEELTTHIGKMEGTVNGEETNDMAMDDGTGDDDFSGDDAPDLGDDEETVDAVDDFADDNADDAEAGPDTMNGDSMDFNMGRARKESFERNVKALRESSNPDALIFSTFVKLYPSVKNGTQTAKLVSEAFGIEMSDVVEIVKEGRSWSKNPDAANYKSKDAQKKAKDEQAHRRKKGEEEDLDEGRSWNRNPDSPNFKGGKKATTQNKFAQDRNKKKADQEELEEGKIPSALLKNGKEASMAKSIKAAPKPVKEGRSWSNNPDSEDFKGGKKAAGQAQASQERRKKKSDQDELEEGRSWSKNPDSPNFKGGSKAKSQDQFAQNRKKKQNDQEELDEAFGKRGVAAPVAHQTPNGVVPLKQIYKSYIDKATKEEAENAAKLDYKKFVNKTVEALYVFGTIGLGETKQFNSKVNNPFLVKVMQNTDLVLTWEGNMLVPRYRVTIVDGKGIIPENVKNGVIHAPQYRVQKSAENADDTPFS
jgi:hypothetical protein